MSDERKPLVYIAGPYTHPDPVENTHKAIVAGEYIETYDCAVFIPHLSLLWHIVKPSPLEKWYERDLHVLERCDAVFRMAGESSGATKEVAHAFALGIPVYYHQTLDNFARWRNLWAARLPETDESESNARY